MLETLTDATPEGVRGWQDWRQSFIAMKGDLARQWRATLEDLSLDQLAEQLQILDRQETDLLTDERYDDDDGFDHAEKHKISIGKSVAGEFMRRMLNVEQIKDPETAKTSFWAAYEGAASAGKDPFSVPYVRALSTRAQLLTELSGIHHH